MTCTDSNPWCNELALKGMCNPTLLPLCEKSCNPACVRTQQVGSSCVDLDPSCALWASQGYCIGSTNDWMKANCARSCNPACAGNATTATNPVGQQQSAVAVASNDPSQQVGSSSKRKCMPPPLGYDPTDGTIYNCPYGVDEGKKCDVTCKAGYARTNGIMDGICVLDPTGRDSYVLGGCFKLP